ncbi:hypothetical protein AAVH_37135, partial [Aphelenchoides avenae]
MSHKEGDRRKDKNHSSRSSKEHKEHRRPSTAAIPIDSSEEAADPRLPRRNYEFAVEQAIQATHPGGAMEVPEFQLDRYTEQVTTVREVALFNIRDDLSGDDLNRFCRRLGESIRHDLKPRENIVYRNEITGKPLGLGLVVFGSQDKCHIFVEALRDGHGRAALGMDAVAVFDPLCCLLQQQYMHISGGHPLPMWHRIEKVGSEKLEILRSGVPIPMLPKPAEFFKTDAIRTPPPPISRHQHHNNNSHSATAVLKPATNKRRRSSVKDEFSGGFDDMKPQPVATRKPSGENGENRTPRPPIKKLRRDSVEVHGACPLDFLLDEAGETVKKESQQKHQKDKERLEKEAKTAAAIKSDPNAISFSESFNDFTTTALASPSRLFDNGPGSLGSPTGGFASGGFGDAGNDNFTSAGFGGGGGTSARRASTSSNNGFARGGFGNSSFDAAGFGGSGDAFAGTSGSFGQ